MEDKLKVLWVCNFMPAFVGKLLGNDTTNKEGWIAGMAAKVLENDDISLAVAYPVAGTEIEKNEAENIKCYGFPEDSSHPENYDDSLELHIGSILEELDPAVIHCFGTEYPHTLALLHNDKYKDRVVLHLQGLMEPYADKYYMGLPMNVIKRKTFRDIVRSDSIIDQKRKYMERAGIEKSALRLATNVMGRTDFDETYAGKVAPHSTYYKLNETLRECFYGEKWDYESMVPHTIFVSQGNYPLKGIHYAIKALSLVKKNYSDVKMIIAGDNITKHESLMEKIKLSSYGKYLLELINRYNLQDNVEFVGQQNAMQMLEQYKKCNVFLVPSVLENSPNSLGEAMLLGVPTVASRVGGIPSMASDEEVILYSLEDIEALASGIELLFSNEELARKYSEAASKRAAVTHSQSNNYDIMLGIYRKIAGAKS